MRQRFRALRAERAAQYARLNLAGLDAAPCQFAVFCDRDARQGHGLGRATMPETLDYPVVLAVHTLWLAARAQGLGLGWLPILDPVRITAILDVPEPWHFIGYFCLGRPATEDDCPALERAGWEHRASAESMIFRRQGGCKPPVRRPCVCPALAAASACRPRQG